MAIKFHTNMIVAKKVLDAVNKKMSKDVAKDCNVEAYANGREQGYSIVGLFFNGDKGVKCKRVCFSENRNSDMIVVYHGENHDFDVSSNIPNGDTYHNRKFFEPGNYDGAANFIVGFISEKS